MSIAQVRDGAGVQPAGRRRPQPLARRLRRRARARARAVLQPLPVRPGLGRAADRNPAGLRRPRRPHRRDLVQRRLEPSRRLLRGDAGAGTGAGVQLRLPVRREPGASPARWAPNGRPRCSSSTATASSSTTERSTTAGTRRRSPPTISAMRSMPRSPERHRQLPRRFRSVAPSSGADLNFREDMRRA